MKHFSQIWYTGFAAQGGVGLGIAPIFLPLIVGHYEGASEAGIIVAMFYFAQMLSPVFGWLADNFNWHRKIYVASYFLVGIGIGFFPLIQDMSFWFIMSFLLGLGIGAANTVAEMFIVEFQPKREWDSRISWLQMFFGVGQAAGLLLAFFLAHKANLALYLSGFLMIPSLLIGLVQLPHLKQRDPVERKSQKTGPTRSHSFAGLIRNLHFFQYVRSIPATSEHAMRSLFHSLFMLYILAWTCVMLGNWLIYNLYPLLMGQVFSMDPSFSSLYFAIGSAIAVPACPISSWLSEKIGEPWVILIGMFMSLVAGLGMFVLALFPFSADVYLVPITFMFLPVAWSPLIIVGTALVSKISSLSQGAALGIFTSVTAMASLIAALSAGFVADNLGFIYVLLLSAAFTIASVVLMFLVKTGLNEQQEQTA